MFKLVLAALALAAASASAAEPPAFPDFTRLETSFKAKNGTKLSKADGPLGEVWDKVAEWRAGYMAKKNDTLAKLVVPKAKAKPTPTPPPTKPPPTPPPTTTTPPPTTTPPSDVMGDAATLAAVPTSVAPPAALGNAYAVRFVKAGLPAGVAAELEADAAAKGMRTVVEGEI